MLTLVFCSSSGGALHTSGFCPTLSVPLGMCSGLGTTRGFSLTPGELNMFTCSRAYGVEAQNYLCLFFAHFWGLGRRFNSL